MRTIDRWKNEVFPTARRRFSTLRGLKFTPRSAPLALLILSILAYGSLIPWLGFYWDDWPAVWIAHQFGPGRLIGLEVHRPLSGWVLALGAWVLGEEPLGWQVAALVLRWLSGLSLWWMLRTLWPGREARALWAAALFLVYPGFQGQFVSVNNSRHLLALSLSLCSFGLMIGAARRAGRTRRLIALSLGSALASLLLTEYYYGLELLRPALLYLALDENGASRAARFRVAVRRWIPYLLILMGVYAWRYWVAAGVNYPIQIFEDLSADPVGASLSYGYKVFNDGWEAIFGAWWQAFSPPNLEDFGPRSTLVYWGLVLVAFVSSLFYLWRNDDDEASEGGHWGRQALQVGAWAFLAGGLSFWVTHLEVKLAFPADRLTLPLMLGVTLLLLGLLDLLLRRRGLQIAVLSVLIALAVGAQFRTARAFQRDWETQVAFFRQLHWRAPGLKARTTLLTEELPIEFSTDNSLTAPLNWIYAPAFSSQVLPLNFFDIELRQGVDLPELEPGLRIVHRYRYFVFQGSTDEVLVVYYDPPACLRLLHPIYDRHFPLLPEGLRKALPLSNPDQVEIGDEARAELPGGLYGAQGAPTWCSYFQKADLARQLGDWERVAELGDEAFALEDSPNHASERLPFIEAYAHVGRWERAEALTYEALEINRFMGPMLCAAWERIASQAPPGDERTVTVAQVQERLACASR